MGDSQCFRHIKCGNFTARSDGIQTCVFRTWIDDGEVGLPLQKPEIGGVPYRFSDGFHGE